MVMLDFLNAVQRRSNIPDINFQAFDIRFQGRIKNYTLYDIFKSKWNGHGLFNFFCLRMYIKTK